MTVASRSTSSSFVAVRALPFLVIVAVAMIASCAFAWADQSVRALGDAREVSTSRAFDPGLESDAGKIRAMIALAASSDEPAVRAACDPARERVCQESVQDNILWRTDDPDNPASKHWLAENLEDLCRCTPDPYNTVNCFQIQVNNNRASWRDAIATCRARP